MANSPLKCNCNVFLHAVSNALLTGLVVVGFFLCLFCFLFVLGFLCKLMKLCIFAYPDLYSVTNEHTSVSHGCYKHILPRHFWAFRQY